jgi:hypothetical protein
MRPSSSATAPSSSSPRAASRAGGSRSGSRPMEDLVEAAVASRGALRSRADRASASRARICGSWSSISASSRPRSGARRMWSATADHDPRADRAPEPAAHGGDGGRIAIPLDAETEHAGRRPATRSTTCCPRASAECAAHGQPAHRRHDPRRHRPGPSAPRRGGDPGRAAIDIPVVGIDFMVPSPFQPDYAFIEANERPGLANHEPQPTAERFVDLLFPLSMPRLRSPGGVSGPYGQMHDRLTIDTDYLRERLANLLAIPSPTGYTDTIVRHLCRARKARPRHTS